jgi:predicted transcriptional regulator
MRIVRAHHPITAADIIARLTAADPTWHPKTARTLLARLVEKKALDYEEHGRLSAAAFSHEDMAMIATEPITIDTTSPNRAPSVRTAG